MKPMCYVYVWVVKKITGNRRKKNENENVNKQIKMFAIKNKSHKLNYSHFIFFSIHIRFGVSLPSISHKKSLI